MNLNQTPSANRLHIGLFGKRNSGKSALINAITGQQIALVSDVPGTTTDPVYKSMEIHGIGPCVLIDTAGFDDEGELGAMRVARTQRALERTELAIVVFDTADIQQECAWVAQLRAKKIPVLAVISKADARANADALLQKVQDACKLTPVLVSAQTGAGMDALLEQLIRLTPPDFGARSLVAHLVKEGDVVLLVMPQDPQAPAGRLILPQVQTIRALLDEECTVVSTTAKGMERALSALSAPPQLIITDSQVFQAVYEHKPEESLLTSFSVLMAGYKGDIGTFVEGAQAIDALTPHARVLIAEACTHAPLTEDIGREKIPRMLRKRAGETLRVDIVSGTDFPQDVSGYDLIIHCGACMFNRRLVMARIERAQAQGVPITNYGIAIAKLTGILAHITY